MEYVVEKPTLEIEPQVWILLKKWPQEKYSWMRETEWIMIMAFWNVTSSSHIDTKVSDEPAVSIFHPWRHRRQNSSKRRYPCVAFHKVIFLIFGSVRTSNITVVSSFETGFCGDGHILAKDGTKYKIYCVKGRIKMRFFGFHTDRLFVQNETIVLVTIKSCWALSSVSDTFDIKSTSENV
jgi:hypothetical protein